MNLVYGYEKHRDLTFHSINFHWGSKFQSCFTKAVINLEPEEKRELNTFICPPFLFGLITQAPCTMEEFRKLLKKKTLFHSCKMNYRCIVDRWEDGLNRLL